MSSASETHLPIWMERVSHIKLNDKFTDFEFIIGHKKTIFNAHKLILAISSPVFAHDLYISKSGMNNLIMLDRSSENFKDFINFIYTGVLEITLGNIVDLLDLSEDFGITILTKKCEIFMKEGYGIKKENVMKLWDRTSFNKLPNLELICFKIFQENATELLDSIEFLQISHSTLGKIAGMEMLSCKEIKLFKAVNKWSEFQCKKNRLNITSENKRTFIGEILSKIRFGGMTLAEFSECSRDCTPLTGDEIIDILQKLTKTSSPCQVKLSKRIGQHKMGQFIRFVDGPSTNQVLEYPQCMNILSISVTRKIYLLGCGIYGRQQTSSGTRVSIQLNDEDESILAGNSEEISFDGTDRVYEILFKYPVRLKPLKEYTFSKFSTDADNLGISYCGINGRTEIRTNGVLLKILNTYDNASLGSIASFIFRS